MFDQLSNKLSGAVNWMARKSRTFRIFAVSLGGLNTLDPTSYKAVVKKAYQKNPYVYAAVNETATSAAEVPPVLYRITGGGPVSRAMEGYERKADASPRANSRKQRVASQLVKAGQRRLQRKTGAPAPLARRAATKALVSMDAMEPVEAHELLDVLHRPNNIYQRSYGQFIKANIMHLELGGETLIEPMSGARGMPRRLYALPPRDVEFIPGRNQPIKEIIVRGAPRNERYQYHLDPTESEILFIKYYNPINPVRGLSPAAAAARSIGVNNEGREWNLKLLQNGAMPSGIVTAKGSITSQQADSLRKKFNQRHAGSKNVGKIMAVDEVEGLDFAPMSLSGKDMMWGKLNRTSALETAIVWGVPPEIIGDSESKTYSNYKEARRAFYLEKVTPLLDFLFGEFNASIVPRFGEDLWLDYDVSGIEVLQDDVEELHNRVREDFEAGLISLNEGRQAIGYEERSGGDVHLVPMNRVPLDTAASGGVEGEEASIYPHIMETRERAIERLGADVDFFAEPNLNGHAD